MHNCVPFPFVHVWEKFIIVVINMKTEKNPRLTPYQLGFQTKYFCRDELNLLLGSLI
jgi:hypothetical protein